MVLLKQAAVIGKPFRRHLLTQTLNLLFPPRCVLCGVHVEQAHTLCYGCFDQLHMITPPACALCGHPFAHDQGIGAQCGQCLSSPPPYDKGWSVWRYDEHSRGLVTRLKYGDRTDLAPFCGRLMAQHGQALLAGADLLMPVPLHWRRMIARRFNQSLLLAREIERKTGVPLLADGLKRVRHTVPQTGLSQSDRLQNVKNVFSVNPAYAGSLTGKTVVLIDDVMTTGATVEACCHALRKDGVGRIHVLTLARRIQLN